MHFLNMYTNSVPLFLHFTKFPHFTLKKTPTTSLTMHEHLSLAIISVNFSGKLQNLLQ